jgi:23S rRNA pseudouridine2605 synthase
MATKRTRKRAEEAAGGEPAPAETAPETQPELQPAAGASPEVEDGGALTAPKKRRAAPRKKAAEPAATTESDAAPAADVQGPVVAPKRKGKKKHDTDQPELQIAEQVRLHADADPPLPIPPEPNGASAEIEAKAQAADAFEEAFEERVPVERRGPATGEAEPPSAATGPVLEAATEPATAEVAGTEPLMNDEDELGDDLDNGQDLGESLEEEEDLDDDEEDLDEDEQIYDEEDESDQEESGEDELDEEEELDEEVDDADSDEEEELGEEVDEKLEGDDEDEEPAEDAAPRPEPRLLRLQKILSQAGVASRRHAEELITEGRVQVNGKVVTELGTKADPGRDHIRVDGKLLHGAERLRYFVLNKPRGYVTTVSDPEGRPTVMEFFAKRPERLYPVGRLDYLSEGLLLMTNDGDLANKLTKAATGVEKTYLVKVSGQPTEEELERLRAGVSIDKGKPGEGRVRTSPAAVRQIRQGDNPWYEVVLIEGRNRELRKMFEEIGHFVEKIRRVGYGPLVLDQEPGQMRELDPEEVELLRKAADGKWRPKPRPRLKIEAERPPRREGAGDRLAAPRGGQTTAPRYAGPAKGARPDRREEAASRPPSKDFGSRPGRFEKRPPEGGGRFKPAAGRGSASGPGFGAKRAPGGFAGRTERPPVTRTDSERTGFVRPARPAQTDRPAWPKKDAPGGFGKRPTSGFGAGRTESRPPRDTGGKGGRPWTGTKGAGAARGAGFTDRGGTGRPQGAFGSRPVRPRDESGERRFDGERSQRPRAGRPPSDRKDFRGGPRSAGDARPPRFGESRTGPASGAGRGFGRNADASPRTGSKTGSKTGGTTGARPGAKFTSRPGSRSPARGGFGTSRPPSDTPERPRSGPAGPGRGGSGGAGFKRAFKSGPGSSRSGPGAGKSRGTGPGGGRGFSSSSRGPGRPPGGGTGRGPAAGRASKRPGPGGPGKKGPGSGRKPG